MERTLGRVATSIYTFALRAFPREQRAVYAIEMTDAFGRELAARQPHGRWRVLRFVVAAWVDGVRAGLGERQYQRKKRRYSRQGEAMRFGMSWLDVKLGIRMLASFPGLTIAGGLALAIAIGLGAVRRPSSSRAADRDGLAGQPLDTFQISGGDQESVVVALC